MNHKKFAQQIENYKIVYIEDDSCAREYISEFLGHYCKNVYSYENAEDGLDAYAKYSPQILLLDINLPGMSGIELATYVREIDRKTRILLLTGYTDSELMVKAVELDISRYLIKPATNANLLLALEKCIKELEVENIINLGGGYIYSKKLSSIISNSERIILRKKEVELLDFFIEHKDEVLFYDILEQQLWKNEIMSRDAIRSQIRNLRKKIPNTCIENIPGLGYRFKIVL